ncbi:MAG: hypothetical protein JXQ29_09835, partial [Planctomycetes bacterium]|nr:hypothetical protein [Planctomycetota bacterium]
IHQGLPFQLPQNVAHFRNGDCAVIDALVDAVFRLPSGGGVPVTLVPSPPLGNPEGVVYDFEGGVVISESGAPAGDRIVRVDSLGAFSIVAQGTPFSNLEDVARIPYLTGPNVGGPGQPLVMVLRVPADAGLAYLTFASLSLYPGFGLPAPDPRGTPLNPDALFFLTVGASSAIFRNWTGALSATGLAAPILSVPNVPLPAGLTIFVQAVTLDGTAPNGIRTFANVHTIRF